MPTNKKVIKLEEENIDKIDEFEWLLTHDLEELVNTANLKILPPFNFINEDDLKTTLNIIIRDLPKTKHVISKDKTIDANIPYAIVEFNGIEYSLQSGSKALQRSMIIKAIEYTQMKLKKTITKNEIDLSILIDKMFSIKREKFTTKGFTQSPYKIF